MTKGQILHLVTELNKYEDLIHNTREKSTLTECADNIDRILDTLTKYSFRKYTINYSCAKQHYYLIFL